MNRKTMACLILGVALLLCALVLSILFLPRLGKAPLTLSLEGAGSLVFTAADREVRLEGDAQKTLYIKPGEAFSVTLSGGVNTLLAGGVRCAGESFSFTMPRDALTLSAFHEAAGDLEPFSADTVVVEASSLGSSALRPFFPSVTQAEDGTILVVYYLADGHALYNQSEGELSGILQLVRSTDGGKSWSEPETLVDLGDSNRVTGDVNREARDPNLQRLSDGTILLSFPVRAPIGKPGLNTSSGNYNDYWAERSYYMTSTDNGVSWSEMREIECDYFSRGEPFLYDDPDRTTGCWVKNGSVAELDGGDLLFPLYGARDCSTRGDYTCVVVRAKNNGDGTLSFYKDWATDESGCACDAARVGKTGQGNELALVAYGDTVYALARTSIPSDTAGGVLYRSTDGGRNFVEYALEPTENDCLNQPNFCKLSERLALVNYSVPLASVASSPARRTARPVYGKLFDLATGDFAAYPAVTIYDTQSATVADMGNPASVLLDDGRIMTVYYDTSAPATKYGFIGATFTTLSDYVTEESPALEEALAALTGASA